MFVYSTGELQVQTQQCYRTSLGGTCVVVTELQFVNATVVVVVKRKNAMFCHKETSLSNKSNTLQQHLTYRDFKVLNINAEQ